MPEAPTSEPAVWTRSFRRRRMRRGEWLMEKLMLLVSLSAILLVFLIFLFVAREAFPIFTGSMDSSVAIDAIHPDRLETLGDAELQSYLELSGEEFAAMDRETLKLLMEVKVEEAAEAPEDKDARVNTTEWRYLLNPYRWSGYEKPEYIWQPVSEIHKYNIVPLLIGSLKATFVALMFAVPVSLAAAIYVSQLAAPRLKEWLKPAIEMLAGIPSVVLGFFALIVMASFFEQSTLRLMVAVFMFAAPLFFGGLVIVASARELITDIRLSGGEKIAKRTAILLVSAVLWFAGLWCAFLMTERTESASRLNTFVAGIALGLAIVPVIFSIAEDALTSVPRSYTQAALALGSSRWQAAWKIVMPAALPGVFAAVVLGFGRAIGETMIVLMASGNASILSWNVFDSTRTITATIAAELAETVFGGHHYRILFMLGTLLFAVTFVSNLAGEFIIDRLKRRMEGRG